MRVFIYACEDTYQGLHGVCDMRVVDREESGRLADRISDAMEGK